jgi:hypothetical protein
MKHNKLSKGSNMRWESMRMMLPEHIEAIQQHKKDLQRKVKPVLDEDRIDELSYIIGEAIYEDRTVRVTKFDPFDDIEHVGKISKIDVYKKRIRVEMEYDFEWVNLEDILDITFE